MRANKLNLAGLLCILLLFSCTKETEQFQSEPLSDYTPLQAGKYITYRLDSTIFTNFGVGIAVHSFQEKHVVDAPIMDALGRPSYRILRFTRDTAGTEPWEPAGSYFITPTTNTVEVIENNLRFVKLVSPITQDNTWKGNRYLPTDPYEDVFASWNNDDDMADWDYTYSSLNGSLTLKGQAYNNVLTVDGVNDVFNADAATSSVVNPAVIAFVNYMQDKYAKGLGLIYQQMIMWEYQPPNAVVPVGVKVGFGVTRSMIDHN
jgi:hypothetical protein